MVSWKIYLVFEFPTCWQSTPILKIYNFSLYRIILCFYSIILLVDIFFKIVSKKVMICKKNVVKKLSKLIPFVIMLNHHFWNYYVPSRAYVRKPPSTTLTRILRIDFTFHPLSKLTFITFIGKYSITRVKYQRSSVPCTPKPAYSRNTTSPLTSHR